MHSKILTFFALPPSVSDKATISPERNCEAFNILACTIMRRMARMPISLAAGSMRPTVNLSIDVDAGFCRMNGYQDVIDVISVVICAKDTPFKNEMIAPSGMKNASHYPWKE